jgi:hypothetical protein
MFVVFVVGANRVVVLPPVGLSGGAGVVGLVGVTMWIAPSTTPAAATCSMTWSANVFPKGNNFIATADCAWAIVGSAQLAKHIRRPPSSRLSNGDLAGFA